MSGLRLWSLFFSFFLGKLFFIAQTPEISSFLLLLLSGALRPEPDQFYIFCFSGSIFVFFFELTRESQFFSATLSAIGNIFLSRSTAGGNIFLLQKKLIFFLRHKKTIRNQSHDNLSE